MGLFIENERLLRLMNLDRQKLETCEKWKAAYYF